MMISADDHIDLGYLPHDLWTSRVSQALKDQCPQVVSRGNEGDYWVCEGKPWGDWRGGNWWSRTTGTRVVNALDRGHAGKDGELRPATASMRLADMDRDAVQASVMYPPIFGMRLEDPSLAPVVIGAYNDWAWEFSSADPKRLIPVAQLMPDDVKASTKEILRVAKLGYKQANFLVGTVTREMYEKPWEPFWAATEECGVSVAYHVGGAGGFGTLPRVADLLGSSTPALRMGLEGGHVYYYPFTSFFTSGLLERYPKLRIVLAESGTGWIPYIVQELDFRFKRAVEQHRGAKGFGLDMLPSEVFRRNFWATYQEDRVGLALIDFFGKNQLMWASDYPHPDSTWPRSVEIVANETASLRPATRERLLRGNARAFYGL